MPKIAHIDKEKVMKVGSTSLSDGQLKNVINQQKVIVARFLDNKDGWHCFYQTMRGVTGEEKGAMDRPHLHYISNKWGISRADLVNHIKSNTLPGTKVHIDLLDYR